MSGELKIKCSDKEMERHFTYKNISFNYHLMQEDRKTIAATVFPSQALIVKAPIDATDARVDDFLRRKFRWVLQQKRYFAQFKVNPDKHYVSGETFRYRGRSHKLLIRKNRQHDRVSLQHGTLTILTVSPKNPAYSKNLLDAWYSEKARKVFAERLRVCFALFDYPNIPSLMIRRMTRRWGSYSHKTKRVILNEDLIKASTRHIDYVIIHELCHITHKRHNSAFYNLLESKLPEWEKLKTELELTLLG